MAFAFWTAFPEPIHILIATIIGKSMLLLLPDKRALSLLNLTHTSKHDAYERYIRIKLDLLVYIFKYLFYFRNCTLMLRSDPWIVSSMGMWDAGHDTRDSDESSF